MAGETEIEKAHGEQLCFVLEMSGGEVAATSELCAAKQSVIPGVVSTCTNVMDLRFVDSSDA